MRLEKKSSGLLHTCGDIVDMPPSECIACDNESSSSSVALLNSEPCESHWTAPVSIGAGAGEAPLSVVACGATPVAGAAAEVATCQEQGHCKQRERVSFSSKETCFTALTPTRNQRSVFTITFLLLFREARKMILGGGRPRCRTALEK